MDRERLREIVLVKAIEDSDKVGVVISHTERIRVTQSVRSANGYPPTGPIGSVSEELLSKMLADRASALLQPVQSQYTILQDVIETSRWPSILVYLAVPLGLFSGFGIRWISDWDRINLMNASIAVLVVWNAAAYLSMLLFACAGIFAEKPSESFWASRAANFVSRRLTRLKRTTTKANVVLGQAIAGFVSEWSVAGSKLLGHQLRRLLHIGAACVGLGLIAGFYYTTWDHEFSAGWASTHDTAQVKKIADRYLEPLSPVIDVKYPRTVAEFETLHFGSPSYVRTNALPWVHLLSLFLLLTVVLPRLLLAAWSTYLIGEDRRRAGLPDGLLSYAGSALGIPILGEKRSVAVFPYDYVASPTITQRLEQQIDSEFGPTARPRIEAAIARGDEDHIGQALGDASQTAVGLAIICSLKRRPRTKYHGLLLSKAHDRHLSPALGMALKLIVDEEWRKPRFSPHWLHRRRISSHKRAWARIAKQSRVTISFMEATP
jgi:hypothetical protein